MPSQTGQSVSLKTSGYKKRYYKRKQNVYTLSKSVRNLYKMVKGKPEKKLVQTAINPLLGVSSTPSIFELSPVSEGDDEHQRTGLTINPSFLKVSLQMALASESETYNDIRVIIFRWFDNGLPSYENVIEPSTGVFLGALQIDNPTKWVVNPRYQILMDKRVRVDIDDRTGYLVFNKKFKALSKIKYNSSTGTGTAHEHGGLFMLIVSDSTVTPHPAIKGFSRLTFTDQ